MKRVIIAAVSSGSGKTTITCGLLKDLKNRGLNVRSYKCGPDYIDPMFHKNVLGIPSKNLDLFFSDGDYVRDILVRDSEAYISVIEGAMGIYDGIASLDKEGSAYDLAVRTGTPIVLLVDAHGMGRTLLSVIKGILLDDTEGLIKGIILNRISDNYYSSISEVIERETGIKVLGHVNKLKDISIDNRHLGLKLPDEIEKLDAKLEILSRKIADTIDIDGIIKVAGEAADLGNSSSTPAAGDRDDKVRLAVAYDEVFCFYYEENFRLLKEAGIELVFFSPLHDRELPDGISGILLGGGYPELKLKELEENSSMRDSIRKAIVDGIPCLAECGGFMYLHNEIETDEKTYQMVGAVNGKCFNTGKLCRFGYVNIEILGYKVKGHEFHYFDSTANGNDGTATKPGNGKQWEFGYASEGRLWGFPHLYYGSCIGMVTDFADAMRKYQERMING